MFVLFHFFIFFVPAKVVNACLLPRRPDFSPELTQRRPTVHQEIFKQEKSQSLSSSRPKRLLCEPLATCAAAAGS